MTRKLSQTIKNFYDCTEAIAKVLDEYTEGDRIEDMTEINKFVEEFRDDWGPDAQNANAEETNNRRRN